MKTCFLCALFLLSTLPAWSQQVEPALEGLIKNQCDVQKKTLAEVYKKIMVGNEFTQAQQIKKISKVLQEEINTHLDKLLNTHESLITQLYLRKTGLGPSSGIPTELSSLLNINKERAQNIKLVIQDKKIAQEIKIADVEVEFSDLNEVYPGEFSMKAKTNLYNAFSLAIPVVFTTVKKTEKPKVIIATSEDISHATLIQANMLVSAQSLKDVNTFIEQNLPAICKELITQNTSEAQAPETINDTHEKLKENLIPGDTLKLQTEKIQLDSLKIELPKIQSDTTTVKQN